MRYTAVAIVLHWAIAAALVANLALGWWMARAIDVPETQLRAITGFQLHKSLGLTVLVLSLLRLAWRLAHPVPPLPAGTPRWQLWLSRATHWAFYVLMIALPLTGWLYVSAQWRDGSPLNVPTVWFGLFEVPHLFGLEHRPEPLRELVSANAAWTHRRLATVVSVLVGLHVLAALKHHFRDRDDVLRRMAPVPGVLALIAVAFAVAVIVARVPQQSLAFTLPPPVEGAETAPLPTSGYWRFLPEQGRIAFTGVHAGAAFTGMFSRWHAELRFDPADAGSAMLHASIETASAADGVAMHESALPQAEWFDVARYPLATFRSTLFKPQAASHLVDGTLTIKDRQLPVSLLLAFDGEVPRVTGTFEVDRVAANLGLESDATGEWVSRTITVTVEARGIP